MSDLRPRGSARTHPLPAARHGRLRSTGPVRSILALAASAIAVIAVSATAVTGVTAWNLASSLKPGVALIDETIGPPPDIGAFEGGFNILLVGSDSGEGDPQYGRRGEVLNDVTILLHVSGDQQSATVVSFPRDMFVRLPGCPRENGSGNYPSWTSKINTALTYGGLACVVKTVEDLTGVSIPFAGKIEFNGVIEMTNAIGGVEVCVGTAINDRQIGFRLDAGTQTISGWDALQFLRSRYGVGDGSDLGRISNQQVYLSALVRKVASDATLTDPIKLYGLAKAAVDNIQLSNSLRNPVTIASIALAVKNVKPENMVMVQYPTYYGSVGEQSGVLPIASAAEELFAAIRADQPVTLTGKTGVGSKPDPNADAPAESELVGSVALPNTITGQSAAQHTCSAGQTAGG